MIPPTKAHLQALAGWSIAARDNTSDEQQLALRHFQAGCGELAEVIDALQPAVRPAPLLARTVNRPAEIPAVVKQVMGVPQDDPCAHRFDIRTQYCLFCGRSYREVRGRVPELF